MRWIGFAFLGCFAGSHVASAEDVDPKMEQIFSDHAQAIEIGRSEFLTFWETRDPDEDYSDYSDEERSEVWDDTLEAFFGGIDDGGTEYMALYAPAFSQYLLEQIPPFSLANELRAEAKLIHLDVQITGQNRIQAEQNRIQAYENRRQEAIRELIKTLEGATSRLGR